MVARMSEEGYIPVTGGRVWYCREGKGPGVPLVTLHGGPGGSSGYQRPLLALADERPVILYDQLGGGKSERPDDTSLWAIERFVEELGQVCAALGLEKFHLQGSSWGTMLGLEYALRQPDRVASMIFTGPVLSAPRFMQDANRLKSALPLEMQETIDRNEAAGTTDSAEYQAASMEWARRHLSRNDEVLKRFFEEAFDPISPFNEVVYNTMQGPSEFAFTGNLKDWDRTDRLGEIKVPALFTCGRYDECTPEATEWYCGLMRDARMVVFEDCAHLHQLEQPDRYVGLVRAFLHEVEAS